MILAFQEQQHVGPLRRDGLLADERRAGQASNWSLRQKCREEKFENWEISENKRFVRTFTPMFLQYNSSLIPPKWKGANFADGEERHKSSIVTFNNKSKDVNMKAEIKGINQYGWRWDNWYGILSVCQIMHNHHTQLQHRSNNASYPMVSQSPTLT